MSLTSQAPSSTLLTLAKAGRASDSLLRQALGHDIYDPAEDEMKNLTARRSQRSFGGKQSDLSRFRQTIQKIIAYDLDLIEHQCDAIVCYWDQYAGRGAGTQGELTFAYRMGIPVYLICGIPVEHISGWLLGCATEVFTSFEEFNEFMNSKLAALDA